VLFKISIICFVELPLFNLIISNLMLIDEKLCPCECLLNFDHLQLNHLMEGIICLLNFPSEQLNLHRQVLQLFLNDGSMAKQLMDTKLQTLNGFSKLPQVVYLGAQFHVYICIFLLKMLACSIAILNSHASIIITNSKDFRLASTFQYSTSN
jgi:hypothetical protein